MSPVPIYTKTQALAESWRCLQCFDAPCIAACPANIHIPRFIRMIRSGNIATAHEELRSANAFVSLCGAVCPESVLCQSHCNRGRLDSPVEIRALHRFITTSVPPRVLPEWPKSLGSRVAIVGAGPSGLGCALTLARTGCDVIIFERESEIGGIPALEIPKIRVEDKLTEDLQAFRGRIKIVPSKPIERFADFEEFDAVFLGIGLGKAARLGIEGEELTGVESASAVLRRMREKPKSLTSKRVVVVGGGNTAMDAALVALEADARVTIVYRRRQLDMPAWAEEVREVISKGAVFRFLEAPVRIIGEKGHVVAVDLQRQELGAMDSTGRPTPFPADVPPIRLPANHVIIAIGASVEPALFPELARDAQGHLVANEKGESNQPRVFIGGDAVHGEGTIVAAFAEGRRVGEHIAEFLRRP
ncbi:MAG: FAD-binding protein [Calditrichaeota bacterium]|nr:FAD-binding protein [Calditrichota bacterium]